VPPTHDAIVVGLGAFGAASLGALADRGARVLGLDRFQPPHTMGSSHGRTRIIREAYFEAPFYVPLVRRAYDAWVELDRQGGRTLLHPCGGLMVGPEDGELVAGTLDSVEEHGIPHEVLDAEDLTDRFPHLDVPPGHIGVMEERAGVLLVERCIETLLARAREAGAEIRTGERVQEWEVGAQGVDVTTEAGRHRTRTLVLAVGPWLPDLGGAVFSSALKVERQACIWVMPSRRAAAWPVVVWEPDGGRILYTVPDLGEGFKAGLHHGGPATHPDRVDRQITGRDEEEIRTLLRRLIPAADGPLVRGSVCLYTNTPDHDFVVGSHPEHPSVIVVGGGSGHGFKFAPVIGEMAADLAVPEGARSGTGGRSASGLVVPPQFSPRRFSSSYPAATS
jgi:sarcosine oxidase